MDDSNAKNADLSALKIDKSRRHGAPGRHRKWLNLLWLLVPVILYFGYRIAVDKVTPSIEIRTGTVTMMTGTGASAELVATGYVVAQIKAAVASKGTGRLRVLNVEEGDSLLTDQIIAELENDDIQAELALAEANLKRALADSVAAARNYQRQDSLHKGKLISEQNYEIAVATYARGIAEVEAMRAIVKSVQVALGNTVIRAPFDGTVLTKHADVGEMVAPFASASSSKGAVVTMADMNSLEVEADVSESNIQKVIAGAPCEIVLDAYPDFTYDGYVKKIVPTADRARATVLTKIAFRNKDNRVLPEMSARVNFLPEDDSLDTIEIEPVMIVPNTALTMRDGQKVVFIIKDNIATQEAVSVGRDFGDATEVISGLQVGDRVALSPPGGLESGDKIELSK